MKNLIKNYGGTILLYAVIILGILAVGIRFNNLNNSSSIDFSQSVYHK